MESGTCPKRLSGLSIHFEHRRTLSDESDHGTRVFVSTGLLSGCERDLANIYRGDFSFANRRIQKGPAENHLVCHGISMPDSSKRFALSRRPILSAKFVLSFRGCRYNL